MAEIMGINVTGDALKDADAVANAIHVFCQELGLDTLQKIFAEKDIAIIVGNLLKKCFHWLWMILNHGNRCLQFIRGTIKKK